MSKRALVIHHLRTGEMDIATKSLIAAGYDLDHRYPIEGDPLPPASDGHDIALMHGSLADVTKLNDPGMAEEAAWIEDWWTSERPFFGICHGLQLASQLLGGRVGPPDHGKAEFGYYPMISHAPDLVPNGLHTFQWHYYGADLPPSAECLASTTRYPNQVVRFGDARYGLQCHAEMPSAGQVYLRKTDAHWRERAGVQPDGLQQALEQKHAAQMHDWFSGFIARWLAEASATGSTE